MDMDVDEEEQAYLNGGSGRGSPPEDAFEEPPKPKDPEECKEEGNKCFKAKQYPQAIEYYTQAIELLPSEPNYWNNRAAAYISLKRFSSALSDSLQAASLQKSSPQAKTLIRLARCQLALGSPNTALSTLRQALSLEPTNSAALTAKKGAEKLDGYLKTCLDARERKDWGVARLALNQLISECEGGGAPEWRLWSVEMEIVKGKWEAAAQSASDALRINENSPDALALRALVLFLTNRLPQALQHAQSTLRLDPEHSKARLLIRRIKEVERLKEEGNSAFKSGRLATAVEKYGETLEVIGDNEEEGHGGIIRATLLSNRATALFKLDQYEKALLDSNAAIELHPNFFKAIRTRARIHQALENYESCVMDFKNALELTDVDESDRKNLKNELKKAEVLLKRSKSKDYYKILGLSKTCSEIEIKKAYRRESLIHHPDKGGDEEKFKLVVEAHAVLSDPQRRDRYDQGFDEDGQTESSGGGMGGGMGMSQADLAEIFASMHGGGRAGFGGGFGGGGFHEHPFGGRGGFSF
ncbi:protein prenylyltransferase [Sistotremastrum suecicum HHB10207 ss-3]|uniref:Protein prenylyltransferase n=1 Tax=Sistotremastrum suecicum HHB10207 ss-3 TaxID=1314776 RepID=A0A166BY16_9AGAM|nr:protein prenylyltransferase [Sistotremastrum suecicum HHB10207 ss-3]